MLVTCSSSTEADWTTTSSLKEILLGATATSTVEDAYLSRLIRRASKWAEDYVGYPFGRATYQEFVASYGSRRLTLARTPIAAVDRVFDATDTGTATSFTTTEYRVSDRDAGFLTRDQGWPWSATLQARAPSGFSDGRFFPLSPEPMTGDETEPWLVDYRAGWTYAGLDTGSPNWSTANGTTSTARTLPDDIEQAVILRAQYWHEGYGDPVVEEKVGDILVRYNKGSGSADSKPEYETLLDPYRRFS